jgi:deoxyribonuclease-4
MVRMSQKFYIGAHISREKTLIDTMNVIQANGGNCLQIFASNPRSAALVNIDNYIKIAEEVRTYCKENDFKLVIHSPYTINLAKELKNGKKTIALSDCYWVQLLLHELHISDLLGCIGVVVHVGKHTSLSYEEGLRNMAEVIHYVAREMHKNKLKTKLLIETPAGQGTELLKDLLSFVEFFNSFSKEEREYLGICLDTAHIWSAGYELDEAFKILFSKNAKDVAVIHYNNSKDVKGAMVDKHATIFDGKIPKAVMQCFLELLKTTKHKPVIILETPSNDIKKEIHWISMNCT